MLKYQINGFLLTCSYQLNQLVELNLGGIGQLNISFFQLGLIT